MKRNKPVNVIRLSKDRQMLPTERIKSRIEVPRDLPPKLLRKDMEDVLRSEGPKRKVSYIDTSDPSITHKAKRWIDGRYVSVDLPGRKAFYYESAYGSTKENPFRGEPVTPSQYAAMAEKQRQKRQQEIKNGVRRQMVPRTMIEVLNIKPDNTV